MTITFVHIDISPGKENRCCNNCKSFGKFGVHLGYCTEKKTEMLDKQKCKKFQVQNLKHIKNMKTVSWLYKNGKPIILSFATIKFYCPSCKK